MARCRPCGSGPGPVRACCGSGRVAFTAHPRPSPRAGNGGPHRLSRHNNSWLCEEGGGVGWKVIPRHAVRICIRHFQLRMQKDRLAGCVTPANWHRFVIPIHSRFYCGRVGYAVGRRAAVGMCCSFAPGFTVPGCRKLGGAHRRRNRGGRGGHGPPTFRSGGPAMLTGPPTFC